MRVIYIARISNEIKISTYQSPVGEILLGTYQGVLCLADWTYRKQRKAIDKRLCKELNTVFIEEETDLHLLVVAQLDEYFAGQRTSFDVPLLLVGTAFQKQVWEALLQIPYGKKLSYTDLAIQLKNQGAIRAVAAANGANALSIIVPCHRIIGRNGSLVGYAGGLPAKKKLLAIESGVAQLSLF